MTTQMDFRYVGKPSRIVFTNALLGDAGFLNSVQRVDLRGESGEAWTTHVSGCQADCVGQRSRARLDAPCVGALFDRQSIFS